MAVNSKKISELPHANSINSADRVLFLRTPASNNSVRTISVDDFAESIKPLTQNIIPNTTVVANSVNVTSNGTNPVGFFSYNIGEGKTGCCDLQFHARDIQGYSVTAGRIFIVANTSSAHKVGTFSEVGENAILFDPDLSLSGDTITVYFRRGQANTSDPVNVRFAATIY
jgi:hypothetical protein